MAHYIYFPLSFSYGTTYPVLPLDYAISVIAKINIFFLVVSRVKKLPRGTFFHD